MEGIPAEVIGKIKTEYGYSVEEDGKTSSSIEKLVNKTYNGDSESYRVYDGYFYEYDKQNKISAEKTLNADGTTTDKYSYEYDKLGQLVRYNDAIANKTYTYAYDNNGNILTKSEYAYTLSDELGATTNITNFGYEAEWKDRLSTVGDKTITYDNIGNPTNYLGATLTWQGRELKSYENEEFLINYEYDENGMRYRTTAVDKTSEENTTVIFDYVWLGEKLVSMVVTGDDSTSLAAKYLYNSSGEVIGFKWVNGSDAQATYYYLKNLQGDITGIVNSSGKLEMSFSYDVWGKMSTQYHANTSLPTGAIELIIQMYISLLNPFGYRGYCYDGYAGFYYLQSRYYDSNTGRFINADDTNYLNATGTVLGCNLFAYCENDPVNFVDAKGSLSSSVINFVVKYAVYSYPIVGNALTTYYTYKGLIYSAANLYLSKKGFELARRMFNHGMYGYGKSPSKSLKDLAVSRLRNSNIMNKIINNVLRYKSVTNFTKYGTVEFKNNNFVNADLYYSLQHVSYKIVGKKNRGKWYLTITVWDRYDFDNIRSFSGITFGNAANDLGWAMQKIGMMVPYNISVTYSIVSYPIT